MHNFWNKTTKTVGAGLLGLVIALIPGGVWGGLYMLNLKTDPSKRGATISASGRSWAARSSGPSQAGHWRSSRWPDIGSFRSSS